MGKKNEEACKVFACWNALHKAYGPTNGAGYSRVMLFFASTQIERGARF
jgi:hypothetical protein